MKTSMDYELMETYADKADLVARKLEKIMNSSMGSIMGLSDIADLDDDTTLMIRDTMDAYRDTIQLIRDQATLQQETHDMMKEMLDMIKEAKKKNDEIDKEIKTKYAKEEI